MKKMLTAVILLFLLIVGSFCYAFADVNQAKEQVVLTPIHIAGDVSAAEGLEILLRNQYESRLHWETVFHPGTNATAETEFTHTFNAVRDTFVQEPRLELNTGFNLYYSHDGQEWNPLNPAYEEMLEDAETGEMVTRTIRLKDYCDYYPLTGMIDLPDGYSIYWNEETHKGWEPSNEPGSDVPGTEAYVADRFQEFFRIPVFSDEYLELHLQKDSSGSMYMSGGGTGAGGSRHYNMWGDSAFAEDAVYFTFHSLRSDGKAADTSLIPGGYGIYKLPLTDAETSSYTETDGMVSYITRIHGVDADGLEMVYPLDPSIRFQGIELTPDQSRILLHTYEKDSYVLTVIDAKTMETLQRLELDGPDREDASFFYYEGDGFFASLLDSRQLLLFTENAKGEYQLELEANLELEENILFFLYETTYLTMDYDGEKLAIAFLIDTEPTRTAFHLAVFEKDGLAYYGQYGSSLGTMPQEYERDYYYTNYEYLCGPEDIRAIQASWK